MNVTLTFNAEEQKDRTKVLVAN